MGEKQAEEAVTLIREHGATRHFVTEAGRTSTADLERRLGVKLPPSYRAFVQQLGAGHLGEVTFYGSGLGPEFDAAEVTLRHRSTSNLPTHYVVVYGRGATAFAALDLAELDRTGEGPVALFPTGYGEVEEPNYVAGDFGQFVLETARRELGLEEP